MRSSLFIVSITVAWSTLQLIGMTGFALDNTGMLKHEHYNSAILLGSMVSRPFCSPIRI